MDITGRRGKQAGILRDLAALQNPEKKQALEISACFERMLIVGCCVWIYANTALYKLNSEIPLINIPTRINKVRVENFLHA